jgi:hypothetical protein
LKSTNPKPTPKKKKLPILVFNPFGNQTTSSSSYLKLKIIIIGIKEPPIPLSSKMGKESMVFTKK